MSKEDRVYLVSKKNVPKNAQYSPELLNLKAAIGASPTPQTNNSNGADLEVRCYFDFFLFYLYVIQFFGA